MAVHATVLYLNSGPQRGKDCLLVSLFPFISELLISVTPNRSHLSLSNKCLQ